MRQRQPFPTLLILALTTFCLFSLSTSVEIPPRHRPPASERYVRQDSYSFGTGDSNDQQFRDNDFDFALLKDDTLSSYSIASSILPTTPTPTPSVAEITASSTSNKDTDNPSTDTTQTLTTSRDTTSQDKAVTVEVSKSTGGSSTRLERSEATSSKTGTAIGSSLTDSGRTSEANYGTSTPTPEDQGYHTMPVPEHLQHGNKTGTIKLRGLCNNTQQCSGEFTECRIGMCKCQLGYLPQQDDANLCGEARNQQNHPPQADPTMIGVVIGLVLMSFTLCVVMRLFAKARFQENRTIFNTPNPRLMNVSLLTGSKKARRGSTTSINSDAAGVEGQGSHHKERISRPRPHRQPSTDTVTTVSEPGGGPGSRPISSNKQKSRQESLPSNSNV